MFPSEYRYSKEHEWVKAEDDGVCAVGITTFAQEELGEVVYVELPEEGKSFGAGDEIGSVESVKAVAEIYAPAEGRVVEVNGALEDAPESLNSDPYGAWIYKLEVTAPPAGLLDAAQYKDKVSA